MKKIAPLPLLIAAALFFSAAFLSSCDKEEPEPEEKFEPFGLLYNPNTAAYDEGNAYTTSAPFIDGTEPLTFSLPTGTPAEVSIDANNGTITASASLAAGTHNINVTVANSEGSVTFSDALILTVNATASNEVTFTNDIKSIITASCSGCHTGGSQTDYSTYANAKSGVDVILDRVQRASDAGGFMPRGGTPLSTEQINLIKQWKTDGLLE